MGKNLKILIIGSIGLLLATYSQPSQANSVSYHLSVTIPAIVGFNLPPFEYERVKAEKASQTDVTTDAKNIDTITEEVIRDNQIVILRTIVAK
jgi:hypothetical protein